MKKVYEALPNCSIDFALKRISGKYKGRILWHLHLHGGRLRYGELRKNLCGVTPKMLTQSLRELADDGLLLRNAFPEVPPKVEYALSPVGQELVPLLQFLKQWGEQQLGCLGPAAAPST